MKHYERKSFETIRAEIAAEFDRVYGFSTPLFDALTDIYAEKLWDLYASLLPDITTTDELVEWYGSQYNSTHYYEAVRKYATAATYDPANIEVTFTDPKTGEVHKLIGYSEGFVEVTNCSSKPLCPASNPDLWNGTCERCGKGTYTGAFNVEHEGGRCDK